MDEKLFNEFLKEKGLRKEFLHFVETKNRAKNNLRYHLYIMEENKDDWLDEFFTITKSDKDFLQAWSKTIKPTDLVIVVGVFDKKNLYGENIQKIFSDCDRYFDDNKSFYDVKPTEYEPSIVICSVYLELLSLFKIIYKDFDNELRKFFVKTSFYETIKEESELVDTEEEIFVKLNL